MKLLFITVFACFRVSVGQTLADLNSQYDDNPIPTIAR